MFDYTARRRECETNKDVKGLAALEVPDLLVEFERLARYEWRHLPWDGGLHDQPAVLLFELDCLDDALAVQARLEAQQLAAAARAGAKPGQYSRMND